MLSNVLVPLDGSEISERALDYLTAALAPDAQIHLLTVIDLPDVTAYSLYPVAASMDYYREATTQAEAAAVQYIEAEAEILREKGYKVNTSVATGVAADLIVKQARTLRVGAIIMATHGRGGFNRWLFGSVTQKVLSAMPCPVLVIPGRIMIKTEEMPAVEVAEETT